MTDAIKVAVRVRPLSKQELDSGHSFAWNIQSNTICPAEVRDSRYTLDHVFGPNWTTRRIYEATTQPLLQKVINGFNSTVFAYGQTSSGKTYTMRGTPDDAGLIPLAVNEIFGLIESCQDREFLLRVSYMELYNEEVHDLLAPKQMKLPIHESRENGVYVCGLREDIVTSPNQVLQLLEVGESNRHVGSTKMNDTSSRSHTVFRMVVESRALEADMNDAGAVLVSTLTLVDLAGSERVAKTGAEGIRMKEGTAINKSLLTLGNVINKLSEGAQAQGAHIPYRDSKLTRILQPSLGGNAKTSVICAITPALCHAEESHSTLRFACRAKRVVNNAVVNEVLSDAAVLKRQAHEIEELKNRLSDSGMTAEVEEQISNLRAQHLRSEQEKDLYRIKLEEEKVEREKAQKQVEVARRMMFEGGSAREEAPKRNSRRETWCPGGKAGWQAPAGAAEAFQAAGSGAPDSTGGRKRSYQHGETGSGNGSAAEGACDSQSARSGHHTRARSAGSGGAVVEGQEEEGECSEGVAGETETVGEGPTPQRRRRAGKSMGSTGSDASALQDGDVLVDELERIAGGMDSQDAVVLETAVSQLGGLHAQVAAMQRELDDMTRLATTKDGELRFAESEMESAVDERDKLFPQLEEARWQARQLEKRLEEAQSAHSSTRKEREALAEQLSALQESSATELQELASKLEAGQAEKASLRDQLKALNASLTDAKDELGCEAEQRKLVEARVQAAGQELAEVEAQLSKRSAELDSMRKAQAAAHERTEAAEARGRELYEANKRLEAHVHDLESRKRAPLYQKKQEEELRAANEKATEADVRAAEAEMNAKEFKEAAESISARMAELQAAAEKSARNAAEAASEAAARHNLEVQRLCNERTKIQDAHAEELERLNSALESSKERIVEQQAEAAAQAQKVAELQEQLVDMARQLAERDAVQAELQACASAASDKIAHLEEEAEATQAAHDKVAQELRQELQDTQASRVAIESSLTQQLQANADAAAEQLRVAQEQAAAQVKVAQEHTEKAQAASTAASTDATKKLEEMRAQVATVEARLAEAAGALKAKDELREERMKHKQEVSSLKGDIQKLQLESKNGGKAKELVAKEMDALKKKVGELDNKLRVAIQDKIAACQEKSKLESQVKQLVSQKQLLDKNQGKHESMELKKRESIMLNFNKSRDTLNTTEEKLKGTLVELQKVQMDLVAKRGECQGLEKQASEHEASISQLQADNMRLQGDLSASQAAHEGLQGEHQVLQGRMEATESELSALRAAHEQECGALAALREEHAAVVGSREQLQGEAEQLRAALQELTASSTEMSEQMSSLQAQHADLTQQLMTAQEELAAARTTASAAEDARIAAESRLPELQELQQQLSAAHEEVADLQYAAQEQQAANAQQERSAAEKLGAAERAAQDLASKLQHCEAGLKAAQARSCELQQQLDQAVELYSVVQGHANTLTADKARLEQQQAEADQAQQGSRTRIEVLEQEVSSARSELESVRSQLSEAATQAASRTEELARAQSTLDGEHSAKEAVQQELAAAVARADAASAQAAEVESLKAQLAQVMQEVTDLEFSWNEERASLGTQAQQLRAELQAAQAAAAAAVAAAAGGPPDVAQGLASDLSGKEEGVAAEGKGGADSEMHEQQQQQQVEGLQGQVASLQQELEKLQSAEAAAGSRVAPLEEELRALRGAHEALAQECDALRQQLSSAQSPVGRKQPPSDGNAAADNAADATAPQQEARESSPHPCGSAFGSPVAPAPTDAAATAGGSPAAALTAAHAARESLEHQTTQLAAPRDQLLSVIDDLAAQLAAARSDAAAAPTTINNNNVHPTTTATDGADPAQHDEQHAEAQQHQQQQQQQEKGHVISEKEALLQAKDAQLQEACQAYNDLTREAAEKDLQLQKLRTQLAAATQGQQPPQEQHSQQQQQQREEREARLAETEASMATLRARCADLEAQLAAADAAAHGPQPGVCAHVSGDGEQQGVRDAGDVTMGEACGDEGSEPQQQQQQQQEQQEQERVRVQELQQHVAALQQELAAVAKASAEAQQQQQQQQEAQAHAAHASATPTEHQQPSKNSMQDGGEGVTAGPDEAMWRENKVQMDAQLRELQVALDNATAARASVEARMNADLQEAQAAAAGLGQELDAARAKVEQLASDLADSEMLADQLRSAIEAKSAASQRATSQLEEAHASIAFLNERLGTLEAEQQAAQQQAHTAAVEVEHLKEALETESGKRTNAQAAEATLRSSLEGLHAQLGDLQCRAHEAETEQATLLQQLEHAQQQQSGPTPAQQEMLARMAQRLEALEAGHRRAVERLHEERDEARASVEALQAQIEAEREQAAVSAEEVDLSAKAKEAELNARMLSLESQIHWLGEQNTQLQAELGSKAGGSESSGMGAAEQAQLAELTRKCAALEADLRRTKRAELKLQALLFRMRSDIEKAGDSITNFDNLRDVRSLEYEVDMLTQKLKRTERVLQQHGGSASLASFTPLKDKTAKAGVTSVPVAAEDKENLGQPHTQRAQW